MAKIPYSQMKSSMLKERLKTIPKNKPVNEMIFDFENNLVKEPYQSNYMGSVVIEKHGRVLPSILLGDKDTFSHVSQSAKNFFVDGTFKVAPKPFSQVLTVMAEYKNCKVPIMHVCCPSKDYEVYKAILEKMCADYPGLKPETWMCDFEAGLRRAIREVHPDARLAGCRFHFSKALVKHLMQRQHLGTYLRHDCKHELKIVLKQYLGLPLIKSEDWPSQLERLRNEIQGMDLSDDVINRCAKFHRYILHFWEGTCITFLLVKSILS